MIHFVRWYWGFKTERRTGRRHAVSGRSSSTGPYAWPEGSASPGPPPTAEVNLELYWKGVRDWCAGRYKPPCEEQLVESCRKLFPDLRQQIEQYGHFRGLREDNYEVSSEDHRPRLLTNLINTEIDIVLESPRRLYIGEAKYKSGFHADGELVLVHQLVRQYVTAKVLVDVLGCDKEIVPFVVVEATGRGARPNERCLGTGPAATLTRLRQLGPLTDDNLLIFRDRTPKGRHYTARPRDPPTGLQDSSFGAGCFGNAKSS